MSITDIQHAALGDTGMGLTSQAAMELAWVAFQQADQALTLATNTGQPTVSPTANRVAALAAFKTLAAALS